MFQGTRKKEFGCHRCKLKDARRRFLNGEGFERVEFEEINPNSGGPSPHGYGNVMNNYTKDKMYFQQENRSPQQSPILKERSMENNFTCKRCSHHHQVYTEKMEYPEQPEFFERGEYRTKGRATRKASAKGELWTPDALRGLGNQSPSPKGGRYVLSPSQRLTDKWNEENLSLRFSDTSMTDCAHCLHHHGFVPSKRDHGARPDHEQLYPLGRGPPFLGTKGNLKAKESSQKGNNGAWWKYSEEKHGCTRCQSHHKHHERMLRYDEEAERRTVGNSSLRAHPWSERNTVEKTVESDSSSPEFTTPTQEFSRPGTPTPQRSYNYKELYERKIQAGGSPTRSPQFELRQLWKPSERIPKYDHGEYLRQCRVSTMERQCDNRRGGSPYAWTQSKLSERKRDSLGGFSPPTKTYTKKDTQLLDKTVERAIDSRSRSPNWSKECLHKRELTRPTIKIAAEKVPSLQKGCVKSGLKCGKMWVGGSTQSPRKGHGEMSSPNMENNNRKGIMTNRSPAQPRTPHLSKEYKRVITRPKPQYADEKKAVMLEENESRWAPPPNWTTRQLNHKEIKGRSPQKASKIDGGEILSTKVEGIKESLNSNSSMGVGDASRKSIASKSKKLPPSRMQTNASRDNKRGIHSPHINQLKSKIDYNFEVISMETQEFGESSSKPYSSKSGDSSPVPKQVFLRIPKSGCITEKDKMAATNGPTLETREKSPNCKQKFDKDIRLRVEIRSELPLDVVDGRLKQFLKGMGGLMYYSPKDGGVPRIKELANYFSGKQPLLWFFPRST